MRKSKDIDSLFENKQISNQIHQQTLNCSDEATNFHRTLVTFRSQELRNISDLLHLELQRECVRRAVLLRMESSSGIAALHQT